MNLQKYLHTENLLESRNIFLETRKYFLLFYKKKKRDSGKTFFLVFSILEILLLSGNCTFLREYPNFWTRGNPMDIWW